MVGRILFPLAALGLIAAATPASAQLTQFNFSGVYNNAVFGSETGAISGHFLFDPTKTHHDADGHFDQAFVSFDLTSPILTSLYGISSVTNTTFAGSSGSLTYKSDYLGSGFDHLQFDFSIGGHPSSTFTIDFNYVGGTFTSDASPPPGLPLIGLDNSNLVLNDTYGDLSFGTLTSYSMIGNVPRPEPEGGVPEPASWALMLLGFGGVGAAMRRGRTIVRLA